MMDSHCKLTFKNNNGRVGRRRGYLYFQPGFLSSGIDWRWQNILRTTPIRMKRLALIYCTAGERQIKPDLSLPLDLNLSVLRYKYSSLRRLCSRRFTQRDAVIYS